MTHIYHLRNLRTLGLEMCEGVTNTALCGVGRISSLQSLDLRDTQLEMSGEPRIANLKNLMDVRLSTEINPDCLDVISEKLKKFEKLHFRNCQKLTELDGAKVCQLQRLKN